MIKTGYRIGGSFEDYCKDGNVGFEILFPHIYSSFEEAEKNNYRISAMMKKQNDGEVVIILYEDKIPVETIHWDEWMKYKCNHLKREKIYKEKGYEEIGGLIGTDEIDFFIEEETNESK